MLINFRFSKANPERALSYALEKNILENPIKRNLFSDEKPLAEMLNTAHRFHKWSTRNERKTFSLIISPDPKDSPSKNQVLEVAEAVLDKFFPTIQGLIVLHKDKGKDASKDSPILHAHFYGSIIDPVSGNNIHLSDSDIKAIRNWADNYGAEHFGWKAFATNEKKTSKEYGRRMMRKMMEEGKTSWMLNLTAEVEDAYDSAFSFSDFIRRLKNKGISTFNINDKSKPLKLGIKINQKDIVVNATTVSSLLSWAKLSNKFNELEDVKIGCKEFKQRDAKETEFKLGIESHRRRPDQHTSGTGSCCGQRPTSGQGRKINFGCIICSKDKEICSRCTEFKKGRGGNIHGYRTR